MVYKGYFKILSNPTTYYYGNENSSGGWCTFNLNGACYTRLNTKTKFYAFSGDYPTSNISLKTLTKIKKIYGL